MRGSVDDLDPSRREHRTRIAGAKRRHRRHAGDHAAGDVPKRELAVDPQARHQILGAQRLVRDIVDRATKLPDARRLERQARRLPMAAEADHQRRAALERAEHVEPRDAAAGSVRDLPVDGDDDRRPVKRVDQLRRDDADHAAVPPLAGHDDHRPRADARIGGDHLFRLRQHRGLFLLPPDVLGIELSRQASRFGLHQLVGRQQQGAWRCRACSCGPRR